MNEAREQARVDRMLRKFMGIMLQSEVRPLRITFKGEDVLIYCEDELLIEMRQYDFEELSANEIVDDINAIGAKQ